MLGLRVTAVRARRGMGLILNIVLLGVSFTGDVLPLLERSDIGSWVLKKAVIGM